MGCSNWGTNCLDGLCACTLYKYSYLYDCQEISGGLSTEIEVKINLRRSFRFRNYFQYCLDQNAGSWRPPGNPCNDLVQEDCDFLGARVGSYDNMRNGQECFDQMMTVFGATYFHYNANSFECFIYDSSDRNCSSMTGTNQLLVSRC